MGIILCNRLRLVLFFVLNWDYFVFATAEVDPRDDACIRESHGYDRFFPVEAGRTDIQNHLAAYDARNSDEYVVKPRDDDCVIIG